jgi:hypothetical protein
MEYLDIIVFLFNILYYPKELPILLEYKFEFK